MGSVSKSLRFEVLARDGFKCRYCGRAAPEVALHVDHIIPRAGGGRNDTGNLATACADCNHGKSDRRLMPSLAGGGYTITPDKRPGRLAKARFAQRTVVDPHHHLLSTGEIDSLDEIDDDQQLALVWCDSHGTYEWHNLPRDLIGRTGTLVRKTKPGWSGRI